MHSQRTAKLSVLELRLINQVAIASGMFPNTKQSHLQPGEILQVALSLFGGHAKRVGTHANVGLPKVPAVVTSRKVLVDDCHAEPGRFLLS